MCLFIIGMMFMTSCADDMQYVNEQGKTVIAELYGWANYERKKDPNVIYEPCIGNIVWSCLLVKTIFAPVIFTGWYIYEPVEVKTEKVNSEG